MFISFPFIFISFPFKSFLVHLVAFHFLSCSSHFLLCSSYFLSSPFKSCQVHLIAFMFISYPLVFISCPFKSFPFIFPIQKSQSNTRNKPNLKMEVHKSNFEDADFDLSIFWNFYLKHAQNTLEVKLPTYRLETSHTNNININNTRRPHRDTTHRTTERATTGRNEENNGVELIALATAIALACYVKQHNGVITPGGNHNRPMNSKLAYCVYTRYKVKTRHNILWAFAWRCCIVSIVWFTCMSMHVYFWCCWTPLGACPLFFDWTNFWPKNSKHIQCTPQTW